MRDETERNYKRINEIRNLADVWIKYIDNIRYECAYSDSFVIEIRNLIKEFEFPFECWKGDAE